MKSKDCKQAESAIKRDLEAAFPGFVVKRVTVTSHDYTVLADEKRSLPSFYHLYPQLTPAQADDRIIQDMEAVIQRHLPGSIPTGFEQQAHDGLRRVEC